MVDTKTQQRVEHISGTNQSQLKITETKTRRNSVTEKVKQIFGKKILSGSSEGEQITTSIGDVDEEVAENLVDSAQSLHDTCMNEGEKVGPVKVSDLLKTVFEHPRQKNTSQIHKHISQWLRNFTSTGIKHMVYLGYLHKDHYITVRDLHRKLQELYGCQSNFPATPDLTLSKISPVNTPILLIDARRPDEYAISHIPGAVNIHSLLSRRVSRHLQNVDPETNIVTYCAAGLRSGWMAARLRHLGFKNVRTLEGFYQWASEGKPMIGEDGSLVRQVLPQHFLASLLLDKDIMFVQTKTTTTNNSKNSKQTTETKVVFKDKNKH